MGECRTTKGEEEEDCARNYDRGKQRGGRRLCAYLRQRETERRKKILRVTATERNKEEEEDDACNCDAERSDVSVSGQSSRRRGPGGADVYNLIDVGMGVADHRKTTFMELKQKKVHRYVIFKVDEKKREVVVEKSGGPAKSYDDFAASLPENDCRWQYYTN
ncbi:hypothetical protein V8G54_022132 [Vigna mungo]|uniref:ADF-H domain-containing protein n=1 Tax=Vigna mungo TaxID=3915 RepID=A0AAQ3NFG0_VIGMU